MLEKSPIDANGPADGPQAASSDPAQPEGIGQPTAANVAPAPVSPPEQATSSLQAHLLGIPDTLPPQWCAKCEAMVTPEGKGVCPRCKRVLKNSFLARRHPINVLRRQQILDKIVEEFSPPNILARSTCEHLASTLERLETTKAGSIEWARLVDVAQKLSASLHDSRLSRKAEQTDDDLSDLTLDDLVARAEALAQRARDVKTLDEQIAQRIAAGPPTSEIRPITSAPDEVDELVLLEPGDEGYEQQQKEFDDPSPQESDK